MAVPRRRRAGRPSAAASAETRERILRAACERFAAAGYGRARNQEIAAAAGLTSAALYHYYDSKAELFAAAWRHGLALVHAGLPRRPPPARAEPSSASARWWRRTSR